MNGPQSLVANFVRPCVFPGESGWWFDSAAGGRGYFVDIQGNALYFAALAFLPSGGETWYVASATSTGDKLAGQDHACTYQGTLQSYAGGQTLTGAYRPPATVTTVGDFAITFTPGYVVLALPGESLLIERYVFAGNGAPTPQGTADPRTGIYWNPAEGGRGFGIEVQNGMVYMIGFMYDGAGLPVWYATSPAAPPGGSGSLPAPYIGHWVEYANGQSIGGEYHPPDVANADAGAMTLQFLDTTTAAAILTLPDGRQIPVTRYAQ